MFSLAAVGLFTSSLTHLTNTFLSNCSVPLTDLVLGDATRGEADPRLGEVHGLKRGRQHSEAGDRQGDQERDRETAWQVTCLLCSLAT